MKVQVNFCEVMFNQKFMYNYVVSNAIKKSGHLLALAEKFSCCCSFFKYFLQKGRLKPLQPCLIPGLHLST